VRLGWLPWRLGAVGRPWRRDTLHGRRGVWWHQPSVCVAGVAALALGGIDVSFAWQA